MGVLKPILMKEHNPKIDYTHISKNHQDKKPYTTFHYHLNHHCTNIKLP